MFMLKSSLVYHISLVGIFALAASCKSKSSGSSPAPRDNTQQMQDDLKNGQTGLVPGITLGGKTSGDTIQVANRELDAIGGIPVVVTGIDVNHIVVGLVTAPTEVTLLGQAGQYRIGGRLPVGVLTAQDVTILARDKSKCQSADCGAVPDASGRFAQGQVNANPSHDYQGQFKIQLASPSGTVTGSGTGGFSDALGNGMGFFKSLFSDPLGSVKSGASTVYDFFSTLFK